MGLGVAKIYEHAIAQILRNETAETAHGSSDTLLIGRHDQSQVFRIHLNGECCRTNKVREQDRDLPTLGSVCCSRFRRWRSGNRGWACEIGNRTQELSAMSERRNPNLFEVLIGQVT